MSTVTKRERKEENGDSPGSSRVNGRDHRAATSQNQDAESDIDELVDSESEAAGPRSGPGPSSQKRARGGKAGSTTKKSNAGARNGASTGPSASTSNGPSDRQMANERDSKARSSKAALGSVRDHPSSRPSSKPSSRRASPARGAAPSVELVPPMPSEGNGATAASSSREMLGRSTTGGPVPYYYAPEHATGSQGKPNASHPGAGRRGPASSGSKHGATSKAEPLPLEAEDLTGQEVDKFLDLIEKYNLDTSNEDDMARSVTELYQEWLEWCAKRNVSCTKSKQALVAEFVRIHHGAYGATRQQRALEIVQGSHSFDHAGMANAALDRGATEGGTRTGARLSANSARESDKRSRPKPVDSRLSPPPTASAGHPLHSPAADPRPLSPSYHDPYMRSIPSTTLESLHRQIFDDVWRETSGMVQQMFQEHASELVVENNAMARRIEQLEMHSDNLAQWVQHLNRVQEDAAMSGRPMRDGPMVMREEMADDHLMGRDAYDGPHRGYGPPGGGHAAEYGPPSPKRLYGADPMPRGGTISPEAPHRSSAGRMHPTHMLPHDVYDRHAMGPPPPMPPGGGHPGMAMAPGPPPPGHGPLFRGSPPMHHVHAGPSHGGPMPPPYGDGVMRGPPPPPGAGNRSFYSGGGPPPPPSHGYEHGGPMHAQHPPSPPVSDPRMLKRARNGY